jgi:hypothetical protein
MNIDDYRRRHSTLLLTADGKVPEPSPLTEIEQDAARDRLASVHRLIEQATRGIRFRTARPTATTQIETWDGMRRWFLAHQAFFPLMAVAGYSLHASVDAEEGGRRDGACFWCGIACRLRIGIGGLIRYGIDFLPCVDIYASGIRPHMPEAFSGLWIRERQHGFQPALGRFKRAMPKDHSDQGLRELRAAIDRADERYHALHKEVMVLAVPDGRSLHEIYAEIHGRPMRITETQFVMYDQWFAVERSGTITRLEYLFYTADILERVVVDLIAGTRLPGEVVAEILSGFDASLTVFGAWMGVPGPASLHHHRSLRGE